MLYSCTHMATVGVKGLMLLQSRPQLKQCSRLSVQCQRPSDDSTSPTCTHYTCITHRHSYWQYEMSL